ncbi:MAG TPA: hypothetical protein PLU54_06235 [Deltaproteobacteria bacterium]|nr:hypothetical protein [Deltaproteobacteria bacterium]
MNPVHASAARMIGTMTMAGLVMVMVMPAPVQAVDITVVGSWTEFIDQADLTGGAGTNLTGTYTSMTNVNIVAITNTTGRTDNWRVDIKRVDTTWDGSLRLSARRTSSGSGTGRITGGTSYLQLTTSDQTLFSGRGDRFDVSIQLRVTGASLTLSPNQYITTVQYTVIDMP